MARVLAILFLPLIYFYLLNFFSLILRIDFSGSCQSMYLIGFALSGFIFFIFFRRISFLATFEHEFTHNLWAVLTLRKPIAFQVTKDQGGVYYFDGRSNVMIALSPYFFPTFSFFLLLLYLIISPSFYIWFFLILGISSGYHMATDLRDFHFKQTDLRVYGVIPSLIYILFFNIIMYGLVLGFVSARWRGMWAFAKSGIIDIINLF
ncbi:MAG: M50 family metallopeptidase [Bacteroidales bacterium]|nr:M50 family metallopeptidase [Bacteroidales bacterium]